MGRNGYAWWYVDALSSDGTHGLTVIAFIGSVFSPYYALARWRGHGDPENHVAMNVALYGRPRRWAMTERGAASLARCDRDITIGSSAMRWDGNTLTIVIDEQTVPLPGRVRGLVTVRPRGLTAAEFALDAAGRHRWRPIAPLSDVCVDLDRPDLRWSGTGYFDTNHGDEPLEAGFRSWTWSRFDRGDTASIFYDVVQRDGARRSLSLDVSDGAIEPRAALPYRALPTTGWRIPRAAPCETAGAPGLLQTMEDAPFYARSAIRSRIDGVEATGVHESLDLARVTSPIIRLMLPFRMFRRTS